MERSGTTAGLRGIHAAGGGVAWASGTNGTVLRTEDGGYEWQSCAMPPGAEKLDFRGIWAWDDNTAIVMSSGTGDASRLYKTTDGCSHWTLLFTNPDKDGFWDAVLFVDQTRGFLLGDLVNGRFSFFTTGDGGVTWQKSNAPRLKAVHGASGVFAASNSALVGGTHESLLFGTGGGVIYRGLRFAGTVLDAPSETGPKVTEVWTTYMSPLARGNASSGIFSMGSGEVAAGGRQLLVAAGGDYEKPSEPARTAAWSADGGKTWTAATKPPHGFRSAVAWDADAKAWIAAGTNGSDISYDDGKTWTSLDDGNWNALGLPWIVGPNGRIAKLDRDKLPKKK